MPVSTWSIPVIVFVIYYAGARSAVRSQCVRMRMRGPSSRPTFCWFFCESPRKESPFLPLLSVYPSPIKYISAFITVFSRSKCSKSEFGRGDSLFFLVVGCLVVKNNYSIEFVDFWNVFLVCLSQIEGKSR